jgi:hypothetical protein
MTDPTDHRQYIAGCRVVACVMAHARWNDQNGCTAGAVKDPQRDRCWYADSDGICNRDRMEHEGA